MFSLFHAFFFNDTATTEIYTLSLHDALPISPASVALASVPAAPPSGRPASGSHVFSSAGQAVATPSQVSVGSQLMSTERSEEHTSELQSQSNLVCRLLLEKKKTQHLIDNIHK